MTPAWPFAERWPGLALVTRPVDVAGWRPDAAMRAGVVEDAALQRAVPKRRAEHVAGRQCACEAMRLCLGLPEQARPPAPERLPDGGPAWPPGLTGSISHGAGWAVAVAGLAAQWEGLGIDVEAVMNPQAAWELAPGFLSDAELRGVRSLPEGELQARHITLLFSLKESAIKLLLPAHGMPIDFSALEVPRLDSMGRQATLLLRQSLGPDAPAGLCLRALWSRWPALSEPPPARAQGQACGPTGTASAVEALERARVPGGAVITLCARAAGAR